MATRPPSHPAVEGSDPIAQPGAVGASVADRIPFKTDAPGRDTSLDLTPDAKNQQAVEAFLTLARQRWQTIDEAESENRRKRREDLDFFASEQWPDKIKQQRDQDGRPCLTINRLPGFVRQLTNEMRDGRPGVDIAPVDNGADVALAETIAGLIQHIEANSDADVAYERACNAQVRTGVGYWRILPEYADEQSFDQELRIKSIRNPNTVYFDHASQELDGSDARYAFIVEDLPEPEFDARFGAEKRNSLDAWTRSGETIGNWKPEGKVRVAEYYCFVPKTRTIVQLANGMVLNGEDLADPRLQTELQAAGIPPEPVRSRQIEGRQLTWALITGAEILDGNDDRTAGRELPGQWIPIVPVYGEEIDLDGNVEYRGVIRDAIDAQRMSNYWKSSMTETVALAPRVPFIAEDGQIEGKEGQWAQANVKNYAVLTYKAKALDGHLVPPPQRNTAEPPIQAMAMLSLQAENDLRATSGFSYDVGANEKRLEQSGRAILARQKQGETGNSHFSAHLAVALRHTGRILLDLIPKYYDTPRVKRILGRDGQPKALVLHAGNPEAAAREAAKYGLAETQIKDLSIGRYDVRVTAGVSYASQRQEDRELMVNALQTNPNLMTLIGDLFFKTLDSPIAERISQRLAKALPPQLQDPQEGQPPPLPPQVQMQMQQMDQMVTALTQRVNELTEEQRAKREELASKERIANIQAQTDLAIAQSKVVSTEQLALLEAKMREIEQLVAIDMARLQAAQDAQQASGSGAAPPPPSAAAPLSPGGPPPPTPAPSGPPSPLPVLAG